MTQEIEETPDGVPISDGFDFPVGPRGEDVNVWDTQYISTRLVAAHYRKTFGVWHPGEDWNDRSGGDSDLGDPIYAISHGRVAEFGYYTPSWGNVVLLEHVLPDGTRLWSQYAHLDEIMVSEVGEKVVRDQQIGTMGKGAKSNKYPRGRWTAHLHFEIRRNELPIDNWRPMVNSRGQVLANYYSPSSFINEYRPSVFASQMSLARRTQIIVDSQRTDKEMGTFRKANVDNWYTAPYGYEGTMRWTYASPEKEANWGEWRPKLPSAGEWEVWVYIPESHATTRNARYKIVHADGQDEVSVRQIDYSNQWVRLGTYRFESDSGYVRLSDVTGEQFRRELMVGFDAVRWVEGE